MRNSIVRIVFALSFAAFHMVSAATVRVPADRPTIQDAVIYSQPGDTVLVSPGVYVGTVTFWAKKTVLLSEEGPAVTTIQGLPNGLAAVQIRYGEPKGTEVSGFTITGGTMGGIFCVNSSPRITHNVIVGNTSWEVTLGTAVTLRSTNGALLQDNEIRGNTALLYARTSIYIGGENETNRADSVCSNTIYGNTGRRDVYVEGRVYGLRIFNNTIEAAGSQGVMNVSELPIDVRNNVITSADGYAIYGPMNAEFNCFFGNRYILDDTLLGVGNVFDDPAFVDAAKHDYRLQPWSPCIDAGDSSRCYLDPDGSQSDIGAHPFLAPTDQSPLLVGMVPSPLVADDITRASRPQFRWHYFDTAATWQHKVAVEVGTDRDWAYAELWSSGEIHLSAKALTYGGPLLQNGIRYYVRGRANNGRIWGDWQETTFVYLEPRSVSVPTDYTLIQSAIDACVSGDTVHVLPGVYHENIDYRGKAIVLLGTPGYDVTRLYVGRRDTPYVSIVSVIDGVPEFRGFTLTNADITTQFIVTESSPIISDNWFYNNSGSNGFAVSLIACYKAAPLIQYNMFYANSFDYCIRLQDASADFLVRNNTFIDNGGAVWVRYGLGSVVNNIISGCGNAFGLVYPTGGTVLDYNCLWNSGIDSSNQLGDHTLRADPQVSSPINGDFRVRAISPCIDAGDPSEEFADPDGSRSDIGATAVSLTAPTKPTLAYPSPTATAPIFNLRPAFLWMRSQDRDFGDSLSYIFELAPSQDFASLLVCDTLAETRYMLADSLRLAARYWWRVTAVDFHGLMSAPSDGGEFLTWALGDIDLSRSCDIGDLSALVDFLFFGAEITPRFVGDVNSSCSVDISDLSYLIDYLFFGGPAPREGC